MPTQVNEPLWGVGAVARRLGVATGTLRTWDRRYGLSPGGRTGGGHRRYSEQDVARLSRAIQLIAEGVPPGQAALVAIGTERDVGAAADRSAPAARESPAREPPVRDPPVQEPPVREPPVREPASSREEVPLAPQGAPVTIDVLLRAAHALDAPKLSTVLSRVFDRRGVLAGWTEVVAPFLVCLGEEWVAGGCGIETEHLASECVSSELRHRLRGSRFPPSSNPPVLLAGAGGDAHELPLVALAAALSDRRIRTWLFGGRLPADALLAAVTRVGPRAVFLWASLDADGQLVALGDARAALRGDVLLLGGPGWSAGPGGHRTPEPSEWVPDLQTAVERISALVA